MKIMLMRLIRSADEEFKEAVVAYFFISQQTAPVRANYLARTIEAWLFSEFRVHVCFDIHDALDKVGDADMPDGIELMSLQLRQLGLVKMSGDIVYGAVEYGEALDALNKQRTVHAIED